MLGRKYNTNPPVHIANTVDSAMTINPFAIYLSPGNSASFTIATALSSRVFSVDETNPSKRSTINCLTAVDLINANRTGLINTIFCLGD